MAETTEQYRTRINQLKTGIENEPYIKKMRENIAEGISKTGNRQADIEVRQDKLEDDFVAVQQDARSNTPSGAELAVAAGPYNTLGERLDAEEQKFNAQLAHTMTQTEFDSWVATLLDGGPSIFMETYAALKAAYPTGSSGVALVRETDPARIYAWNGTDWQDFGEYQGLEIKDRNVTNRKIAKKNVSGDLTTFFEPTINLFNKIDADKGKRVASGTGNLVDAAGVSTSNFIPVSSSIGKYLTRSHVPEAYAIYTSDKVFLRGGSSGSSVNPIELLDGDGLIKVSVKDENLGKFQLEYGQTASEYQEYYGKLSSEVIFDVPVEKTTFLSNTSGKNKFDKSKSLSEKAWRYFDGALISYAGFSASDYMPVVPGQFITRNYVHSTVFTDEKKAFVIGLSTGDPLNTKTIKVPEGCHYILTTVDNTVLDTYQLEDGEVQTNYEEYIGMYELDKPLKEIKKIDLLDSLNYWKNKTVVFNGDSIAAGWIPPEYEPFSPYPNIAAEALEFNLVNYSIGGSTLCEWGGVGEQPRDRTPLVTRINEMSNSCDGIGIAIGTNDWQYDWVPLGDMSDRTTKTFYGGLHTYIAALLEKYSGKPIFFITPIKRGGVENKTNGLGNTLREFCEAIIEVCNYYSVPVFDAYTESMLNTHVPTQAAVYVPDLTHPNQVGHEVFSRRFIGWMKQLA